MLTLVRAIGALASVMVMFAFVGFVMQKTNPPPVTQLPHGLTRPALAIEFAVLSEIDGILGQRDAAGDSPMRSQLRNGLYGDYFFIAMYWLLFAGMSALLATRNHRWAVWAGVVAALCATGAAIFDVVENLSIAAVLDAREVQAFMVRNVSAAGFGKWILVSIAVLVLSLVFLRRNWFALLCGLYLLIGILGIYGLLVNPRLVELSLLLLLASVLAVAVIFSVWPQKVLERH
jgi:hypothetical protein